LQRDSPAAKEQWPARRAMDGSHQTSGRFTGGDGGDRRPPPFLEHQRIEAEGPKREKRGKRKKGKKKGEINENEKSKERGREPRCRSSFHFPFLLTWVDLLAGLGARLRHHA
jgi:hypothetical protein